MSLKETGKITLQQVANLSPTQTGNKPQSKPANKKSRGILTANQKKLRKRILEVSFEQSLSHLGSCFSVIDIIDAIYKIKKPRDKFVLSNGHAGIAWYVILEKYGIIKNPKMIRKLYIHPDRNPKIGIEVSTGSLGQGLPIALGMAMADKTKSIYCMVSDGECAEGSIWEAFRIASDFNVNNLKIIVNANGWGAYDPVSLPLLLKRIKAFGLNIIDINGHDPQKIEKALNVSHPKKPTLIFARTTVDHFPFLKGQHAHYHVMSEENYNLAMEALD